MSVEATKIIERFEKSYPMWMAEPNDPNGLHIGTLKRDVQRCMITLDIRPDVVKEAIEQKVDLIVAKHPLLFVPAERLTDDNPQTKMYNDLIRNNITVYVAHTNIDIAPYGLNDWLMEDLECEVYDYLEPVHKLPYQQFLISTKDNKEIVESLRTIKSVKLFLITEGIQGIVSPKDKQNMIQLLHEKFGISHNEIIWQSLDEGPYEEYGIGRIGILPKPLNLAELSYLIKEKYEMDHVRLIAKDEKKLVQKVAICSGSGQKFYQTAKEKGADVYITGDVYYHTGHDMLESNLAVIDAGHYIEHLMKPHLAKCFEEWNREEDWNIEVLQSKVNTNPFRVY